MSCGDELGLSVAEMQAWRGLLSAHSKLYGLLDEELLAEHGITFAEYEVLVHTSEALDGSIRMAALAEAVLVSRSGLTRRVQHLVAQGYLERRRCKEDRRGSFAALTAQGWEKLEEAAPTHRRGVRQHFLSLLSQKEIAFLAKTFAKINEAGDIDESGRSRLRDAKD